MKQTSRGKKKGEVKRMAGTFFSDDRNRVKDHNYFEDKKYIYIASNGGFFSLSLFWLLT